MDTALPQKFPFILDRNLAKANWTENRVCTSCDIVVLDTERCRKRINAIIIREINSKVKKIKTVFMFLEFCCTVKKKIYLFQTFLPIEHPNIMFEDDIYVFNEFQCKSFFTFSVTSLLMNELYSQFNLQNFFKINCFSDLLHRKSSSPSGLEVWLAFSPLKFPKLIITDIENYLITERQ